MKKELLVIIHDGSKILYCRSHNSVWIDEYKGLLLSKFLNKRDVDDYWLLFVSQDKEDLIPEFLKQCSFQNKMQIGALGYHLSNQTIRSLGYVEDSPFLNTRSDFKYPTWVLNSDLFVIHGTLFNKIPQDFFTKKTLQYNLLSLSKLLIDQGVFCYQILLEDVLDTKKGNNLSTTNLYTFVKQHYKNRWTLLLLLSHIIYERRFPLYAFAKAQLYPKINFKIEKVWEGVSSDKIIETYKYEVVIPTLGRAPYLKNVLLDFKSQYIKPQKVIIVEQNPDTNASSELTYVKEEQWPFEIEHIFIHKTGACNARNCGLSRVTEEWIMLFDDDVRFGEDTFSKIFNAIKETGAKALNIACLQDGEIEKESSFVQWKAFGSGCSMVHRDIVDTCKFDMALEHGYGEDIDYGMQIRQAGFDVIYAPQIQIKHLKAPIGGFRKPHVFPWNGEEIQPKPSPQIMYYRLKNTTREQLKGYKLVLFLKFYRSQKIKNPLRYYKYFKNAWNSSVYWSQKLLIDE